MNFITETFKCDIHGDVEIERMYRNIDLMDGTYEKEFYFDAQCSKCSSIENEKKRIEEEQNAKREHEERMLKSRINAIQLPLRFKTCSFENYITETASQVKNKTTCLDYAEKFSTVLEKGKGLLMVGSVGTGKTHLACSIALHTAHSGYTARYDTLSGIVRNIRSTWAGGRKIRDDVYSEERTMTESDIIDHYCSFDLLIIDEVGVQSGSENERNLIFTIIDERYQECKPTIAISNLTESELAPLISERSIDRLKQGSGTLVFKWDSHRKAA